jgi:hypothetical protein
MGDVAPDLAQLAERPGCEHGVEHELAERAAGHAALQHVGGAVPEDGDDARRDEEDDPRRQACPRQHGAAGGVVGALAGRGEAVGGERLAGEGLHGPRGADRLGREGGGLAERVLGAARSPAHGAAEGDQRQDDRRQRQQHQRREPRARPHHHGGGAEEQDEVAERDRGRGPEGSLDLRRVRRQPRGQLAGSGLVVEGRRERQQVPEHRRAKIGDDALAERGDEIVAGGRSEGEHGDHHQHGGEILVHERGIGVREAVVDDPPHGERHRERRRGGDEQGGHRRRHAARVAQHERQELNERPQRHAADRGAVAVAAAHARPAAACAQRRCRL